MRLLFIDN